MGVKWLFYVVLMYVLTMATMGNRKRIQKSWLIDNFVSGIAVQDSWGLSQSMSWEMYAQCSKTLGIHQLLWVMKIV